MIRSEQRYEADLYIGCSRERTLNLVRVMKASVTDRFLTGFRGFIRCSFGLSEALRAISCLTSQLHKRALLRIRMIVSYDIPSGRCA